MSKELCENILQIGIEINEIINSITQQIKNLKTTDELEAYAKKLSMRTINNPTEFFIVNKCVKIIKNEIHKRKGTSITLDTFIQ